ncbi:MAG: hypothetical protein JO051_12330 [Acidobacteriaceae bacterium]|nr:hypothetical protein [Acidobacteriaceae bacterium]
MSAAAGAQRRCLAGQWVETAAQIGEHFDGHPRADAGIEKFAIAGVIAVQQRPEMRSRPFRIELADDDEFLAVERVRLPPEAAVPGA